MGDVLAIYRGEQLASLSDYEYQFSVLRTRFFFIEGEERVGEVTFLKAGSFVNSGLKFWSQ